MKNKKHFLIILTSGIVFIYIFSIFRSHYKIKYTITENKQKYFVLEEYQKKTDFNKSNYYFEIKIDESEFNFQIYSQKIGRKSIKKIYHYKDKQNECIFPVFKNNKQLIDIICLNGKNYIYYRDMQGDNKKLDKYVEKIKEYDLQVYSDSNLNKENDFEISNEVPNNYYFLLENYKGIYIINQGKIKNDIKLFEQDVYKKNIKYFIDKYFIIADYNEKYEFHKFYVIDIINGKKKEIISEYSISMDSYIQGDVDGYIYLFDPSNKRQYKIDYKNNKIEVYKKNAVMIYQDDKWEEGNIYIAINEQLLFNYGNKKYDKKIGNYYYTYEKINNNYLIYRDNVQKVGYKNYITKLEDYNKIFYSKEDIYYVDNGYLKLTNDLYGTKTILYNRELEFNDDLLVGITTND